MIARREIPVQTPDGGPLLASVRAALASGLPCTITTRVEGRHYRAERRNPAHRVARIVEEGRRGAVAVMDDRSRVRIAQIVAVELHRAQRGGTV